MGLRDQWLGVEGRVASLSNEAARLEGRHEAYNRLCSRLVAEVESLKSDAEVLEMVVRLFERMLRELVGESLEHVEKLVTAGLRAVFEDKTLSFKTEMDLDRKVPVLKFYIKDEELGVEAPPRGNFGGGCVALADFLLRVICILKLGLPRVMFQDETLSQVSAQYLPAAGEFIRKLCAKLGMDVVLVTHSDFQGSADTVYKATMRRGSLHLSCERFNGQVVTK